MLEKTVKRFERSRDSSLEEDLAHWLGKTPRERIAAVEFPRGQYPGRAARLQADFRDLLALFSKHAVDHLNVGAYTPRDFMAPPDLEVIGED